MTLNYNTFRIVDVTSARIERWCCICCRRRRSYLDHAKASDAVVLKVRRKSADSGESSGDQAADAGTGEISDFEADRSAAGIGTESAELETGQGGLWDPVGVEQK